MCFKSKIKTPKVNTNLPAPEPVLLETPKGVEYGTEESGAEQSDKDTDGKITKIDKEQEGDGTTKPVATDKGYSKAGPFSYATSSIKKNLAKRAKR